MTKNSSDKNNQDRKDDKSKDITASLIDAISANNTNLAVDLINAGADVNVADKRRFTALMIATRNGNTNLIEALINARANVNAIGGDSEFTALITAAHYGHANLIEALINARADINIMDLMGETALTCAAANHHNDSVQVLLKSGANLPDGILRTNATMPLLFRGNQNFSLILILSTYVETLSSLINEPNNITLETRIHDFIDTIKQEGYEDYLISIFNSSPINSYVLETKNIASLKMLITNDLFNPLSVDKKTGKTLMELSLTLFNSDDPVDVEMRSLIEDEYDLRELSFDTTRHKEIEDKIKEVSSIVGIHTDLVPTVVGYSLPTQRNMINPLFKEKKDKKRDEDKDEKDTKKRTVQEGVHQKQNRNNYIKGLDEEEKQEYEGGDTKDDNQLALAIENSLETKNKEDKKINNITTLLTSSSSHSSYSSSISNSSSSKSSFGSSSVSTYSPNSPLPSITNPLISELVKKEKDKEKEKS